MSGFIVYIKKRYTLILSLIAAGFGMTALTCSNCCYNANLFFAVGSFSACMWLTLWLGGEFISEFLDIKIPWTKQPAKRFATEAVLVFIYVPSVVLILTSLFELLFNIRLVKTSVLIYGSMLVTVIITLFLTGRQFLINWRQVAIDAERFKRESVVSKYENLKNQLDPHFLFNSLNTLTNLVYENPDKAAKFIKQLSEVYRYVLDTKEREVVPLEEETNFLKSYLFLQQIRFGSKLQVDINLNGTTLMVAPLALQMLVENAIKHNIISEDDPLTIKIYLMEDFIVVENTLQPRQETSYQHSSGVGLENIKRRYEFLSSGLEVHISRDLKSFKVKLPVIKNAGLT